MRSPFSAVSGLCSVLGLVALLGTGCPPPPGAGEGEGEGAGEGEGEGAAGEGEGEGQAGEGEGEGEGGAGEGEGEGAAGEGEGEGEGGPACATNDNCVLGNICVTGSCTPGCSADRDCPNALLCDTSVAPHGLCAACVVDGDCDTQAGQVCFDHACTFSCTSNTQCTDATLPVCNATNGVCVNCVDDGDCSLGSVCVSASCTAGCHQDRDCVGGQVCDLSGGGALGQCVVGCSVDGDCPLGTHCSGVTCALGCNNNPARCGQGDTCVVDTCKPACQSGADCPNGETCVAAEGACEPGCQANNDCGFGQVCDLAGGVIGSCVQCLVDQDCGNFGAICDTAAKQCRGSCDPTQSTTCFGLFGQGVCASDGVCVQCTINADCGVGETCDPTTRACVAPPPASTLCQNCQVDADCGGTNQCVRHHTGPNQNQVENTCGIDCSTGAACPSGFACELVADRNDVVVGQQCVPASSVVAVPTCDAFRDTINAAACITNLGALCGIDTPNAGDGVCLPPDAATNQGACTEPCGVNADCPVGFVCDPVNFPNFPVPSVCVHQ